jgi:hypothetical protein
MAHLGRMFGRARKHALKSLGPVAALCLLIAAGTVSARPVVEQQWGQRHWTEMPIQVVDYGVGHSKDPRTWRRRRDDALGQWERSGVVRFRVSEAEGPICDGWNRRALGRTRRDFPEGQISICRWRGDDAPLIAGYTSAPPGDDGAVRKAVVAVRSPNSLCHELGHALGLDHPTEDTGASSSCLGSGDWRYPSTFDLGALQQIYARPVAER